MLNGDNREQIEAAFELLLESVDLALDDALSDLSSQKERTQHDLGSFTHLAILRQRSINSFQTWQACEPHLKMPERTSRDERRVGAQGDRRQTGAIWAGTNRGHGLSHPIGGLGHRMDRRRRLHRVSVVCSRTVLDYGTRGGVLKITEVR